MENLHEIMGLIDTHSDMIPQGDYLAMCNHVKKVFAALSDKELEPPMRERVQFSHSLMERHNRNNQDIHENSLEHIKCVGEYQSLKPCSRITRAVQIAAGSEDRGVCIKFLEDKNLGIRLRRQGVERRISVIENEMKTLRMVQMMIRLEMDREFAMWRREHPGVEGIISL